MDRLNIGQLIASERKRYGITQKELADKLAISDKTVSKWETGRGLPDVEMLISMCQIFDISLNELITGERFGENGLECCYMPITTFVCCNHIYYSCTDQKKRIIFA